jgi:hypothetical protein
MSFYNNQFLFDNFMIQMYLKKDCFLYFVFSFVGFFSSSYCAMLLSAVYFGMHFKFPATGESILHMSRVTTKPT